MAPEQGDDGREKPLWFLYVEQEVEFRGGVHQSHVEVPPGQVQSILFNISVN